MKVSQCKWKSLVWIVEIKVCPFFVHSRLMFKCIFLYLKNCWLWLIVYYKLYQRRFPLTQYMQLTVPHSVTAMPLSSLTHSSYHNLRLTLICFADTDNPSEPLMWSVNGLIWIFFCFVEITFFEYSIHKVETLKLKNYFDSKVSVVLVR